MSRRNYASMLSAIVDGNRRKLSFASSPEFIRFVFIQRRNPKKKSALCLMQELLPSPSVFPAPTHPESLINDRTANLHRLSWNAVLMRAT